MRKPALPNIAVRHQQPHFIPGLALLCARLPPVSTYRKTAFHAPVARSGDFNHPGSQVCFYGCCRLHYTARRLSSHLSALNDVR